MSSPYYGDFATGTTVNMVFDTFAAATGAPTATTNFAAGDVNIYKNLGTTQRSSSAGITVSTSFDGVTGMQTVAIDLSDNTDAGFYAAGNEYQVMVTPITADGQTMSFWLGTFSIQRSGGALASILAVKSGAGVNVSQINAVATTSVTTISANVGTTQPINFTGTGASALVKGDTVDIAGAAVSATTAQVGVNVVNWNNTVVATPATAGIPDINVKNIANAAVSTSTAQVGVNIVNIAGTASKGTAGYVGIDWAQISAPTTTVDLSGTTIKNLDTVPPTAAAIATAVWQDATAGDFTAASSIGKSLYTAGVVPGAAGGHFIAGTNAATTITTSLTTTFTGNLTGSVASVTGAVGSVTGAVGSVTGNVGGNVTGSVGSLAAQAQTDVENATWDATLASHLAAGSTGNALNSAGSAGDPWSTALPGVYGSGSAGFIIGTTLDAAISTRTKPADTQAAVTTVTNLTNAATAGDFTATMKTSLNAATPASVVGAVGSVTGAVGSVTGNVGGNVVGSVGSVTAAVVVDGTSPLTEAYPTKTGALTLASSLYSINEQLANRSTSGTTITVLKRDQTTTAMTFTIDDPVDTTSIKQS